MDSTIYLEIFVLIDILLRHVLRDGHGLDNVTIFSIGLGNAAKPEGRYIAAPPAADLNNAFSAIASEILRLAK